MEQRIKDRYSESILDQARAAYGIKPDDIHELDGFESYIYDFKRGDQDGILRISHSIRRTPDQIRGELDWINYLKYSGASVAGALISQKDRWVEEISDGAGGYFLANVFEKAVGKHWRGDWTAELLHEYGRQIGLLHKLTTTYQLPNPNWKRPEWDDPVHLDVDKYIPDRDNKIKEIFRDLIQRTRELPKDGSSYGLIHQDAHQGNFFVDETGKITIFDFDDCSYSWFVEDIALILFYAVMGQDDPAGFTDYFLSGFLPGYFSEHDLEASWFREIPLFMKRREIDLYALIHRSFDVDNLDDPWCKSYLEGRKERLEGGVPYLAFEFSDLDLQKYR